MLVLPISNREFELYALSLPTGSNFDPFALMSCWKARDGRAVGAVLLAPLTGQLETLVLRRQVDHRFIETHRAPAFSPDQALEALTTALRPDDPPEPLRSGMKRRPALSEIRRSPVGKYFQHLTTDLPHLPALMTVGETYLAMPNPDDNFVPDIQGENFSSRLWELYLLATFREQGTRVSQPYTAPDFLLERNGEECFVEAVTAHSAEGPIKDFPLPVSAPEDHKERVLGAPAVRFAKTLRSKLQRNYEQLPHVVGKPFVLAIADFHASGAMTWSREALPTYLYGRYAHIVNGPHGRIARETPVDFLLGDNSIPASIFRDPAFSHLSAVIFSNAGTMSKFTRMGFLAGWRVPGLHVVREGIIFDSKPGALDAIPFKLDIASAEYEALWPGGECWSQELEVYHNPNADRPISFDLLPDATHWHELNGEIICATIWENCVLSSITYLLSDNAKVEQKA